MPGRVWLVQTCSAANQLVVASLLNPEPPAEDPTTVEQTFVTGHPQEGKSFSEQSTACRHMRNQRQGRGRNSSRPPDLKRLKMEVISTQDHSIEVPNNTSYPRKIDYRIQSRWNRQHNSKPDSIQPSCAGITWQGSLTFPSTHSDPPLTCLGRKEICKPSFSSVAGAWTEVWH